MGGASDPLFYLLLIFNFEKGVPRPLGQKGRFRAHYGREILVTPSRDFRNVIRLS